MRQIPFGNGSGKVLIGVVNKGPDWVVFQPGDPAPESEELPLFLNRAVEDWLTENPDHRVRATLEIVVKGNTSRIHVWCDVP